MKKTIQKNVIGVVSLGCDKNRVDLEKMIAKLSQAGYIITTNLNEAYIALINTCSFILDARKESIESILRAATLKSANLKHIVVTGCLNNMRYTDLHESLPEVDKFVPITDNDRIVDIVDELIGNMRDECKYSHVRTLTTPSHYAYLKIADGCNNFCSYCTIPYIRGRFKSVPMKELIKEAKELAADGVTELILVAQDVTKYGYDFHGKLLLTKLIKKLSKIKSIKLIRLLYCYPDLIDDKLIKCIATNKKVAKYIDIPLQHINNQVLKAMNRRTTKEQIIDIINKLRRACPDIVIRSTFILGFPGETKEQFDELCDFVSTYKLDNVGFFKYSREEGTRAYDMPNQVSEGTKSKRLNILSQLQYKNVIEHNQNIVSKVVEVVVDKTDGKYAICRTAGMCPDVDGVVYIKNSNLTIGNYYKVKITKFDHYDLEGEVLWTYLINYH